MMKAKLCSMVQHGNDGHVAVWTKISMVQQWDNMVMMDMQYYGQQEVWCSNGTTMLHGAAMISNGTTKETWCSMVQHMVQQWSMTYNAQWDSNGTMVQHGTTSI